jgi:hypothetical protein
MWARKFIQKVMSLESCESLGYVNLENTLNKPIMQLFNFNYICFEII